MKSPKYLMSYVDRSLDCEQALEDGFLVLVDEACESGWNAAEVAVAITNLAHNLVLKLTANEDAV